MSTLGDGADVDPVIKLMPHTCNVKPNKYDDIVLLDFSVLNVYTWPTKTTEDCGRSRTPQPYIVMHRKTTFRSTTNPIHDCGPMRL